MGFVYHPVLPEIGEDEGIVPLLKERGFEAAFVSKDRDAPGELGWYEGQDLMAPSRWTPALPHGEGWLVAAPMPCL